MGLSIRDEEQGKKKKKKETYWFHVDVPPNEAQ